MAESTDERIMPPSTQPIGDRSFSAVIISGRRQVACLVADFDQAREKILASLQPGEKNFSMQDDAYYA